MAALFVGAVPLAGGAQAAHGGCLAPDVVGVSLSMARHALGSSGCALTIRQLPAHGRFVTPSSPDGRQLVARQSPPAGARSRSVTVWVKPLCSQSASPAPAHRGPDQSAGPTELIAGLYLSGGPLQRSPRCKPARTVAGTLTVSTPSGTVITRHTVRAGRFAIFPLAPGSYMLGATLAGGSHSGGAPLPQTTFTIASHRTTRVNLVAAVR